MSTPLRQLILEDLEATLQQITTANGFDIGVAKVSREKKTDVEVAPGDMPYVQIFKGNAPARHYPFGYAFRDMTIELLSFVTEPSAKDADDSVDRLRRAILDAVTRDGRRGGAAISTKLTDEYEGVHPDSKTGQLRMALSVLFVEKDNGRDAVDMAYGHIYLTTPDGTVNWAVDDTYEKLTLATTAGPLKDFTHTTPNKLTYTGTLSRTFEIQASISARTPAGSTQKNVFAIFKNGTLVPGSFQTLRAQTAEATPNNANPMTMVTLANGDYIEIYGQVPGAGIDSEIANLALSVRELTR